MRLRTPAALALLVVLTACGTDAPEPDEPTTAPTSAPTPDTSTSGGPTGGTVDDPVVAEPTTAILDWQDAGVEPGTRYVRGPEWEAVRGRSGTEVELGRGDETVTVAAGPGRAISEVLMSDAWAVVVRQDQAETEPSTVVTVDLASGEQGEVVSPAAASGGSWALTDGDLYYPTYGDGRAYCLATAALADNNGEDGWCAPARSGFSGLTASEHGVGIMTFDDARPVACRTVNLLDASGVPQPLEGPADCTAWDVAATADGAVWSEVPKPRRREEALFRASADGAYLDLGPGVTGSAVPCGDSVFFVRDPQGPDEPARLMRWTPDHTLEIAYESASVGNAFLGEPACGGGVLSLSSFGEEGDETVWASVG
ncbi:hypothetical protein GCM10011376_02670 [Nocardioides flavus (ex Wang et al. 2016)]|uniref:WD40-like Beta Propeller Repeat n=1 Tax=Nocardioides flavus (ex Wang et al. 2016) TaxID=2058780 RepID=A0ABQ3HDJ9_9ACTN|nr:hypothetical protein [Nocardioides flavus (ex Wang et al. 2016)]GHE15272.1 hypothetical protein GCM10011376_02670 [Nocardioides flavus (ex Wang et al. 2016)]